MQEPDPLELRWVVSILAVCALLAVLVAEIGKSAGPPW